MTYLVAAYCICVGCSEFDEVHASDLTPGRFGAEYLLPGRPLLIRHAIPASSGIGRSRLPGGY